MSKSNARVILLVPIFKRLANTITALRHVTKTTRQLNAYSKRLLMMNQRIEGTESWTNYWICVYHIALNKNDILSNSKLI